MTDINGTTPQGKDYSTLVDAIIEDLPPEGLIALSTAVENSFSPDSVSDLVAKMGDNISREGLYALSEVVEDLAPLLSDEKQTLDASTLAL